MQSILLTTKNGVFLTKNMKIDLFTFFGNRLIGLLGTVFANGPGGLGSIPKCFKMELDTSSLNTQQYKVRVKGRVKQSWERSSALPYTSV